MLTSEMPLTVSMLYIAIAIIVYVHVPSVAMSSC